jgi:Xaa-Pro aminopeptidase
MADLRAHRRRQLDDLMQAENLEALLISGNDYFHFCSNLPLGTFYWERPFALVIPNGSAPFAIVNSVAENGLRMQVERGAGWIDDLRFYLEIPTHGKARRPADSLIAMLRDGLAERGLENASIGVDARTGVTDSLARTLPELRLASVAPRLKLLRQVKHAVEIEIMQQAASMCDWGMRRLRDELRPGRIIQQLDYAVGAQMLERAADLLHGENFQIQKIVTLSGSPSASTDGDGAPTGARIEAGVPTVCVIVVRLNGYSVEIHRTFVCGTPSAEAKALLDSGLRVSKAAAAEAYAGNRLSRIQEASWSAATADGLEQYFVHRAGHGIGTATHEFPEDIPLNSRPIELNEVFSLEPGLYRRGLGGVRFGDAIVAGTAPRPLTTPAEDVRDFILDC